MYEAVAGSRNLNPLSILRQVIAGVPFEWFLQERVFSPLSMTDTHFAVPAEKLDRFATCYMWGDGGALSLANGFRKTGGFTHLDNDKDFMEPVGTPSGGGGLVSTLGDFMRFCQMLLNRGTAGRGSGRRLLSPTTIDYMRQNHLHGEMPDYGPHAANFLGINRKGFGFGLGFAVIVDPTAQCIVRTTLPFARQTPVLRRVLLLSCRRCSDHLSATPSSHLHQLPFPEPPGRPAPSSSINAVARPTAGTIQGRVLVGRRRLHPFLGRF